MVEPRLYNQAQGEALAKDTAGSRYLVGILDGFIPSTYDQLDLTYVASGNGAGEIETVVYKLDSATVGTLTLTYNSDDKISSVVRS